MIDPDVQPAVPRPARGQTFVAWLAILLAVGGIVGSRFVPLPTAAEHAHAQTDDKLTLVIEELQLRYIVGLHALFEDFVRQGVVKEGVTLEHAEKLNAGSIEQRLRFIPVAGEIGGPEAALSHLALLRKQAAGLPIPGSARETMAILQRVYEDAAAGRFDLPSVRPQARSLLREELDWFGDLALHPPGSDPAERDAVLEPAIRTAIVMLTAFAAGLIGMLLGAIGLVIFLATVASRGLPHLSCGVNYAGVYAETFALWLIGYFGLTLAAGLVLPEVSLLLRAGVAMMLSLSVLAWPVLRGIPWSQVRADIGWGPGRGRPLTEVFMGVVGYVLTLPLVAIGFGTTILLIHLQQQVAEPTGRGGDFSSGHLPAHPIVQFLAAPDWQNVLQIFFLASIAAPIVEETMFRGVLYRHLREVSCRLGTTLSIALSAIVVSLIFAAIHPQGVVAIPILMSLALGFCILREWRGSLLPCMVAHGLNNALAMTIGLLALAR